MISFHSRPAAALSGRLQVPGDKSISHRALMLAAVAEGDSDIEGFLPAADCIATMNALRRLGVSIEHHDEQVQVHGAGRDGLRGCGAPLDLGNSGTSLRLLTGLLAGQPFASTLAGDASLNARPMRRIINPLRQMGADLSASPEDTPPLSLQPTAALRAIHYRSPMASAQLKSCLLLAGLYADGETAVTEPAPSRDHTERMLHTFGCPSAREGLTVVVKGGVELTASRIRVPGDFSSAAFFIVAACIVPGSDIVLEGVGINPTRTGALEILRRMGARIEVQNERGDGDGEPVADIRVRAGRLLGVDIPAEPVPGAIDEFPVLFIAAACADGITRLRGAAELRVKESDRIAAMANGLRACGIAVETFDDGVSIQGGRLHKAAVDSRSDHRIAMAFAVAGAVADGGVVVHDCANVATSFPGFTDAAGSLGFNLACV